LSEKNNKASWLVTSMTLIMLFLQLKQSGASLFLQKKIKGLISLSKKKQVPHYFLIKNADFFFGEITLNFFFLYSKEIMRHAGWLPP
jgi:hypothetical protein